MKTSCQKNISYFTYTDKGKRYIHSQASMPQLSVVHKVPAVVIAYITTNDHKFQFKLKLKRWFSPVLAIPKFDRFDSHKPFDARATHR